MNKTSTLNCRKVMCSHKIGLQAINGYRFVNIETHFGQPHSIRRKSR